MSQHYKASIQTISPAKAKRLLELNTYDGQRPPRDRFIDEYGQKMLDGRFHTGSVAVVEFEGKKELVDGQKQLMACVEYDVPFRAVMHEYTLNGDSTQSDIAGIFAQYNVDDRRTRGDIAHAKAAGMGWKDWPSALKRDLATALDALEDVDKFCISGSGRKELDETGDLFRDNRKACEWVCKMVSSTNEKDGHMRLQKGLKHMCRVPVYAAMISSFRVNQKAANDFWSQIRDGENLVKGYGPYLLREYLKNTVLQSGSRNVQQKAMTGRKAMYSKCVEGWNAWREDRTTTLRVSLKAPVPKMI